MFSWILVLQQNRWSKLTKEFFQRRWLLRCDQINIEKAVPISIATYSHNSNCVDPSFHGFFF